MRFGSLCSGYGGLDLAVADTFDAVPAWHFEIDPHASRVLEHHWPGDPNLGDLTSVDWSQVVPVEVICGGYPCQPFSTAGRRKGTDDDRHIWPHIAECLRVLRPRWAVFENVAGHLSLGFDRVLADLAEAGFDAEWLVLPASAVGAPHRRERLFVLAADASHVGHERSRFARGRWHGSADGGGGAAADAGSAAIGQHAGGSPAEEAGAGHGDRSGDHRGERAPLDWGATPYAAAVRRWEHLTGRPAPHPAPDGRLSPLFVEWMMGLPEGWVTSPTIGLPRTAQLKILGNGVVPQQARAALAVLLDQAQEAA